MSDAGSLSVNSVYDNCRLFSPDGKFINFCPKHKLDWYLKRNLGEMYLDDKTLKLNFEPKLIEKCSDIPRENLCNVCGSIYNLRRHCIVPKYLMKYFPDEFKVYRPDYYLLLCEKHKRKAEHIINDFVNGMCEEFNIYEDDFIDIDKVRMSSYAQKIITYLLLDDSTPYKSKMTDKTSELIVSLRQMYSSIDISHLTIEEKIVNFTIDELKEIQNMSKITEIRGCTNLYQYLVKQHIGMLEELIYEFRLLFLGKMEPKYLPVDF